MNVMMMLLTILLLPMGEQLRADEGGERVEIDMVLHIEFTNADGYPVVDTPVTYQPDSEYGEYEFGCETDKAGQCDMSVQFETSLTHPSIFGSVYVHDVHVQAAVFRRSEREMTIPIQSSANRLNPHETIHDHDVQIIPVPQETVAVMLSRPPQVSSERVRPTPTRVMEDVPSETVAQPIIPVIIKVDEAERVKESKSTSLWWWSVVIVFVVMIVIMFAQNVMHWGVWR